MASEEHSPDDVVEPTALCAEYGSPHPQHVIMRVTTSQAEIDRWLSYDGEGYDSHYISAIGEGVTWLPHSGTNG